MDNAVAFVDAYLRVNGFLTVTEYPVLHRREHGVFQEVTDVDVLACRLPHAGRVLPRGDLARDKKVEPDAVLGLQKGRTELLVAEVKEGAARFNAALFRADVLREALRRFGACPPDALPAAVAELSQTGETVLEDGSRIRLMVFASRPPERPGRHVGTFIPLSHVVEFLRSYVRAHWRVQAGSGFRDPVLNLFSILEKAAAEPRR